MLRSAIFRFLLPLLVTLSVAYWLSHSITLSDLRTALKKFDLSFLALFCCLSFFSSLLRTLRFSLLLSVSGERIAAAPLFCIVLVRNFCSDLLPARIGSAIFIPLARSTLGVSWKSASSSFAASFLFDVIVMGIIFAGSVFLMQSVSDISLLGGLLGASLLVAISTGLFVLGGQASFVKQVASWMGKLHPKLAQFSEFLVTVSEDMRVLRKANILLPLFFLTLAVRGVKYISLLVLLQSQLVAFDQPLTLIQVPKAMIGMLLSEAAASLPFSGIGGFGLYEGVWAASFSLLGFETWLATVTGIAHHLFTQAWGIGLAAFGFVVLSLHKSFPLPGFALSFATRPGVIWAWSLLALAILSPIPFAITSVAATPAALAEVQERVAQSPQGRLDGVLLFDSNQSGNFDIMVYDFASGGSVPLVSSPKHEQRPVFHAPTGSVLYDLSPSSNRYAPSDIHAYSLETGQTRLIFENGQYPNVFRDDSRIVFGRERRKIMLGDLNTGEVERLIPSKRFPQFRGQQNVRPVLSADQKYLSFVSSYPRPWTVWRLDLETDASEKVADSCQSTFLPDSHEFVFVSLKDAQGGTGIWRFSESAEANSLLDRADPRGKEYFPFPASKRWLFFGACNSAQHSHETSNYEIMAKDSETNELFQVTNNGSTNRWPHFIPNLSIDALVAKRPQS